MIFAPTDLPHVAERKQERLELFVGGLHLVDRNDVLRNFGSALENCVEIKENKFAKKP